MPVAMPDRPGCLDEAVAVKPADSTDPETDDRSSEIVGNDRDPTTVRRLPAVSEMAQAPVSVGSFIAERGSIPIYPIVASE